MDDLKISLSRALSLTGQRPYLCEDGLGWMDGGLVRGEWWCLRLPSEIRTDGVSVR